MRNDMAKIVSEPAKRGVGYYRTLNNEYRKAKTFKFDEDLNVTDEFCVNVLPMRSKRISWEGKEHSYAYRTIRRYTRSQVGKVWDDVYSEICKKFRTEAAKALDMKTLFADEVEQKTWVEDDGKIYYRGWGGRMCCAEEECNTLYVDPRTGILCISNGDSYRIKQKNREKERNEEAIAWRKIVCEKFQFHKVDGNWFRVILGEITSEMVGKRMYVSGDALGSFDVKPKMYYEYYSFRHHLYFKYGAWNLWAIKKESASKADIRRYKLN